MAAAKQASAEAKVRAAADAERRIEESRSELARVKDQLAAVLDYKQRKELLEEEVAKLNAEMTQLRTDTAEQVWQQISSAVSPLCMYQQGVLCPCSILQQLKCALKLPAMGL